MEGTTRLAPDTERSLSFDDPRSNREGIDHAGESFRLPQTGISLEYRPKGWVLYLVTCMASVCLLSYWGSGSRGWSGGPSVWLGADPFYPLAIGPLDLVVGGVYGEDVPPGSRLTTFGVIGFLQHAGWSFTGQFNFGLSEKKPSKSDYNFKRLPSDFRNLKFNL